MQNEIYQKTQERERNRETRTEIAESNCTNTTRSYETNNLKEDKEKEKLKWFPQGMSLMN